MILQMRYAKSSRGFRKVLYNLNLLLLAGLKISFYFFIGACVDFLLIAILFGM